MAAKRTGSKERGGRSAGSRKTSRPKSARGAAAKRAPSTPRAGTAKAKAKAKNAVAVSRPARKPAPVPTQGPPIPPVVRTADARFRNLPDYPFAPRYVEVASAIAKTPLRMHYVDEGPRDAEVMLMLHGEPAWSYLYRKMIPVFAGAGLRAIAVDLIGFGRSDKPTRPPFYSFASHVDWVRQLVVALGLRDITLVCQDWGGPIGMGVLAKEMDRFARVVAGNTMLHTAEPALAGRIAWANHGSGEHDSTVSGMLLDWTYTPHRLVDFEASHSIAGSTVRGVAPEVLAAYDAPFPSEWHKAGMRQFPGLIPVTRTDVGARMNLETWQALARFDRPFLTLFGDSDPATRGWEQIFAERVPGAQGQPHQIQSRAGHFWQEDNGPEAARMIADWIASTR
ncbi:MAG: haloalkane dehalogenase [Myxococcota bacterium]